MNRNPFISEGISWSDQMFTMCKLFIYLMWVNIWLAMLYLKWHLPLEQHNISAIFLYTLKAKHSFLDPDVYEIDKYYIMLNVNWSLILIMTTNYV